MGNLMRSQDWFEAAYGKGLRDEDWKRCAPQSSARSGTEYRKVWSVLSGDFEQEGMTSSHSPMARMRSTAWTW